LRTNIHAEGRRYPAAQLCQQITGLPLSHDPLIRHLRGKFGSLYDLG
jgi:carboxypeptidase Taq